MGIAGRGATGLLDSSSIAPGGMGLAALGAVGLGATSVVAPGGMGEGSELSASAVV
jgi:hypothetical protein